MADRQKLPRPVTGIWGIVMTEAEEAISRWDLHARELMGNFTSEGDHSRIVLLNPTLFDLLGDIKGKKILDAGCGEGYLSRMLTQRGATVTGVDFSTTMLDMAKSRTPSELSISYCHGNCEALLFLDAAQFDIVVSNMVIQDLPDYQAAIAEAYRLIKPGGVYIFSILHPCFVTPTGEWVRDDAGQKQYRRVDQYFAEGRYEQQLYCSVFWYHRTLSSYITTLLQTGFTLEALVEPRPSVEKLQQYPKLEDCLRIPDFLVFKVRKPL